MSLHRRTFLGDFGAQRAEPGAVDDHRQHRQFQHHRLQDHVVDVRESGDGLEQFDVLFVRRRHGVRSRQHHPAGTVVGHHQHRPTSRFRAAASSPWRMRPPAAPPSTPATAPSRPTTQATWRTAASFSKAGAPTRAATSSAIRPPPTCRPSIPRSPPPAAAPRPRPRSRRTCRPTRPTGATFTSSMTVYDSLGTANSIQVTWTKKPAPTPGARASAIRPWRPVRHDHRRRPAPPPVRSRSPSTATARSPRPTTMPTIAVTGWTNGAADSSIALNLGTVGKTDGLTQYASGETTPAVNVTSITSDGLAFGKLSSIAVGKNGVVNATYSNGQTIAIYKIAVATFADPDALAAHSDGMYSSTVSSGNRDAADLGQQRRRHDLRQRAGVEHDRHQRPVQQHDLGAAGLFGGLAGDHDGEQDVRHPDLGDEVAMADVTSEGAVGDEQLLRRLQPADVARQGRRRERSGQDHRADRRYRHLAASPAARMRATRRGSAAGDGQGHGDQRLCKGRAIGARAASARKLAGTGATT